MDCSIDLGKVHKTRGLQFLLLLIWHHLTSFLCWNYYIQGPMCWILFVRFWPQYCLFLLSQLLEATSDWKFKRKMSPAKRLFDVLMHMHYISTKGWFELLFEFSGHLIVWELSLLRFWILVSSYRLTVTFPKILVGWCAFISCPSEKY